MLKLWIVGSLAGALLALMVGTASATTFELPAGERFRVTWGPIEFIPPAGAAVRCNMTIEGSFHSRTIAKVTGSLLGYVTRAAASGCAGTVLAETLPWHFVYTGFSGTLPSISSIRASLVGFAMRFTNELASCLARTTSTNPLRLIAETAAWEEELELEGAGVIVPTMRVDESARIPLTGTFCSGLEGSVRGRGDVTVLGGTRKMRLALTGLFPEGVLRRGAALEPDLIEFFIWNTSVLGGQRVNIGTIFLEGPNPRNYAIEDPNLCEGRQIPPDHICTFLVRRIVPGGEALVVARVNFAPGVLIEPVR